MGRNLYLKSVSIEEAHHLFNRIKQTQMKYVKTEIIDTKDAYDRVLSEAIFAQKSVPAFPSAAMDGIAIASSRTQKASDHHPLILNKNDYQVIDTGDIIKSPYDCVIMAEDCIETEKGLQIIKAAVPYENVRPIGEDVVEGELIFPMEHVLDVMDLSVLIASHVQSVSVYKQVRIGIIPSGDEIKNIDDLSDEADIIESNSYLFSSWSKKAKAIPTTYPIVEDVPEKIEAALKKALAENDVVIINAGSSAGRDDYSSSIIEKLGKVYVHGIAIKPGKPAILGQVGHQAVFGVPGFPVSAHIIFEEFIYPFLLQLNHRPLERKEELIARSNRTIISSLKSKEYVRVKVAKLNGQYVATPLARGAGMMMSVIKSDGYALIDQNSEGIKANDPVKVQLNKSIDEIDHTLVAIGSHDLLMDLIRNALKAHGSRTSLSSIHVGSYAGILALSKHESKLAMSHLLDKEGTYNLSSIKPLFKEAVVLIKGVKRIQGFIVKKGNPLNIHSIQDLKNVRYINRQKGSGTRFLLDYLLEQEKISSDLIQGYGKEVSTHLAVAASVASDEADVGLGVFSAAQVMNCDFIELAEEDYDFVCYKDQLYDQDIQDFIDILKNDSFIRQLQNLGGYKVVEAGRVIDL